VSPRASPPPPPPVVTSRLGFLGCRRGGDSDGEVARVLGGGGRAR
jgi:hypothetical protein